MKMLLIMMGVTSEYFLPKAQAVCWIILILLLCMLLMCTLSSFAISIQGHLEKFDALLMLLIGSLVWICTISHLLIKSIHTGVPGGTVSRAGAPYTEAMSWLQRIQVWFHLWPFAACHSPSLSLSPLFPVYSSAVMSKELKTQKNIWNPPPPKSLISFCLNQRGGMTNQQNIFCRTPLLWLKLDWGPHFCCRAMFSALNVWHISHPELCLAWLNRNLVTNAEHMVTWWWERDTNMLAVHWDDPDPFSHRLQQSPLRTQFLFIYTESNSFSIMSPSYVILNSMLVLWNVKKQDGNQVSHNGVGI